MKEINGVDSRHRTNPIDHARCPGSSGHRGRHLGSFKHKHARADATTTTNAMPLVQQQLSALNANASGTDTSNANAFFQALNTHLLYAGTPNRTDSASTQPLDMTAKMMILNDLKQTNAKIANEIQFLSRFGAISSAF